MDRSGLCQLSNLRVCDHLQAFCLVSPSRDVHACPFTLAPDKDLAAARRRNHFAGRRIDGGIEHHLSGIESKLQFGRLATVIRVTDALMRDENVLVVFRIINSVAGRNSGPARYQGQFRMVGNTVSSSSVVPLEAKE